MSRVSRSEPSGEGRRRIRTAAPALEAEGQAAECRARRPAMRGSSSGGRAPAPSALPVVNGLLLHDSGVRGVLRHGGADEPLEGGHAVPKLPDLLLQLRQPRTIVHGSGPSAL